MPEEWCFTYKRKFANIIHIVPDQFVLIRIWIRGYTDLKNRIADPDPDPALFFSDFQEANKK
jgi:hypothetical protein